jgi:hypothetical protein
MDNIEKYKEAFDLVFDQFQDIDEVKLWFETENPLLGNLTPLQMVKYGRVDKLLKFIKGCREESQSSR